MRKRRAAGVAFCLVTALAFGTVSVGICDVSAKSSPPELSKSGKTLKVRQNFLLQVKKKGAKEIKKTKWSVNDDGANFVALTDKKKTSVRVLALNDPGTAKIKAKVKYTIVKSGKTVTETKTLKCKVTVKESEATSAPATMEPFPTVAPTIAPSQTPAATAVPGSQYGTMNYNATDSTFEITFASSQQNANNPDSTEASGNRVWTTNVSKIVRINWQGSNTYYLTLTKATLDPSGIRLTVYADPGSIRLGAYFDAALTGFYGAGETPNASSAKAVSMSSPVSSLQAVVDTHLTQPMIGTNKTVCLSVTFNQPMKSSYAYDRSASQTGTLELGGWQASANQIAKVYEVNNGNVSTQANTVAGATAYKPKDDTGIERVVIDLGTSVSSGTREYKVVLYGFSPDKAGGISVAELSARIKFTPENLNVTGGSYETLKATTTTNGEATDVIIRLNVANAKGNGTLMKKSDAREQGWPSDHVTVKDANNNNLTVTYLKSTINTNQIEIGVLGGRTSTQFTVQFLSLFPYSFLSLTSSQLVSVDTVVTVTANGASSSGGGTSYTDTATYDAVNSLFLITFPAAYFNILDPDTGTKGSECKWESGKAPSMFSFYKSDSSGAYSHSARLAFASDEVTLSADGKSVKIHVDPANLTNGTRYAIVPVGFVDATTMYPIDAKAYYATVGGGSSAIKINSITSRKDSGTAQQTIFKVDLSAEFTVATAYDNTPTDGSYKGVWTTNAGNVVNLYRVDNTVMTAISVGEAVVLKTGNTIEIKTSGTISSGTYMIMLKGIRPAGTTVDTTLTGNCTVS